MPSGQGDVSSEQRLKKSQRSYEHGNGSYESEQQASTAESYLGQQISGADYIKEETESSGLNDLSSNLSYRGQGRFRTISEPDNRSALDLDEEYVGEYSMQRKVHLGGASHFDLPHITLNKTGRLVPGTVLADYTITVLNDGHTSGREPVHRSTAPLPRRMAGL